MDKERVGSFEQLKVWQEAHALVMRVFEMTPKLPSEQQEGLALAMERTAVEVPRGIAEGFKRRGSRNKAHYYNMAQTSLEALRYYFMLCRDLKYDIDYEELSRGADQTGRMLEGLVRSMTRGGGRDRGRGSERGDRGERRDEPSQERHDEYGEDE